MTVNERRNKVSSFQIYLHVPRHMIGYSLQPKGAVKKFAVQVYHPGDSLAVY